MRRLLKYKLSSKKVNFPHSKSETTYDRQNYNNFKQNQVQLMNQLVQLTKQRQWDAINKLSKNSKLLVIDNWSLWTSLASILNKVSQNVESMKQYQLDSMLDAMRQLNYEIYSKSNPKLCEYINKKVDCEDLNLITKIGKRVLQTNPSFFTPKRQKLEQKLLTDIKSTGSLEQENHYLFASGLISQFWTPSLIQQMNKFVNKQSRKIYNLLCLQSANLIQPFRKRINYSSSKTQRRMGLAIADIGYVFENAVEIDGTEVDFYQQSCKLILEYNGIHHYRINSGQNRINYTRYMHWRKKCLLKKGFVVIEIPFYEWNKLYNEKSQKLYLIDKIQKYLLKDWVYFPDSQKMQKIKIMQENSDKLN